MRISLNGLHSQFQHVIMLEIVVWPPKKVHLLVFLELSTPSLNQKYLWESHLLRNAKSCLLKDPEEPWKWTLSQLSLIVWTRSCRLVRLDCVFRCDLIKEKLQILRFKNTQKNCWGYKIMRGYILGGEVIMFWFCCASLSRVFFFKALAMWRCFVFFSFCCSSFSLRGKGSY